MAQQEQADGLAAHARYQFTLDRFLGYQPHRPARAASRWTAAHHGNHPLFLAMVQDFCCAGPRLLIERPRQAALLITMADFADGLWRERQHAGNARRTDALGQLQKYQSSQHHPHRLLAATYQTAKFLLIVR